MTACRRRVLRPVPLTEAEPRRTRRRERQQRQLDADLRSVRRWTSRLRRAFHAVERLQSRIDRLKRQLGESR